MTTTTSGDTGDTGVGPEGRTTAALSRWQKVVGIAGVAVVVWVGSELYDVIVFDGTFPGGGRHVPADDRDRDTDPTPPTTGGHDPSQFGH